MSSEESGFMSGNTAGDFSYGWYCSICGKFVKYGENHDCNAQPVHVTYQFSGPSDTQRIAVALERIADSLEKIVDRLSK